MYASGGKVSLNGQRNFEKEIRHCVELYMGGCKFVRLSGRVFECVHAIAWAKTRPCETAFGKPYPERGGGSTNFVCKGCKFKVGEGF